MRARVVERVSAGYVYVKHIRTDEMYCGKWCVRTSQTKMLQREVLK